MFKVLFLSLALSSTVAAQTLADYYDNTGRDDVVSGGVKMIPIETPQGTIPLPF